MSHPRPWGKSENTTVMHFFEYKDEDAGKSAHVDKTLPHFKNECYATMLFMVLKVEMVALSTNCKGMLLQVGGCNKNTGVHVRTS